MIPRQDRFHLAVRMYQFDSIEPLPLKRACIFRMPSDIGCITRNKSIRSFMYKFVGKICSFLIYFIIKIIRIKIRMCVCVCVFIKISKINIKYANSAIQTLCVCVCVCGCNSNTLFLLCELHSIGEIKIAPFDRLISIWILVWITITNNVNNILH